jgi:hypothetical protein
MRSIRTMVAAGVTLVALGGLTAVALSAGNSDAVGTSVPSATTDVRTQVVEQVVHRTRRARGTGSSGTRSERTGGTVVSRRQPGREPPPRSPPRL